MGVILNCLYTFGHIMYFKAKHSPNSLDNCGHDADYTNNY